MRFVSGQEVIQSRFGRGIIEDDTGETYRVKWETHRTDGGRDWSHVNYGSVARR